MNNVSAAPKPKKVAIVGAGASGMICARECLKEGHRVKVFEKSEVTGGTWVVDAVPPEIQKLNVLREDYHEKSITVHSSMYDNLRTNLPREIMGFSEFPFDESFPGSEDPRRFCTHHEVRRYLDAYKRMFGLDQLIQIDSTVIRVEHFDRPKLKWDVEIEHGGKRYVDQFDAVVVSNGHYSVPHVPEIPGIENFSNLCLHSHLYRRADPFKDMTVAILGNANSGRDLAQEIGGVGKNVYLCGRKWLPHVDLTKPIGKNNNIHYSRTIVECTGKGQLKLEDGSVLNDVDVLIFCTGYGYGFPFLKGNSRVTTDNRIVYPVYKHIIHPNHTTLAFTILPYQVLPFIFSEYQSKFIARVFSERLELPDKETMMKDIDEPLEEYKNQKKPLEKYLNMSTSQFPYMDDLAEMCGDVEPLSRWREEMLAVVREIRNLFPDDYRNRDFQDPCFHEARQEFASIKESTTQQENVETLSAAL